MVVISYIYNIRLPSEDNSCKTDRERKRENMQKNPTGAPLSQNPVYVEAYAVPSAPPSAPHAAAEPIHVQAAPLANFNDAGAREYLTAHHWPTGLQETFVKNLKKIPMRFFICDDSGSMSTNDGHKLIQAGGNFKMISCTRWNELTVGLKFHAGLARAAGAPSEFRLLNGAAPIMIGDGSDYDNSRFESFNALLEGSPSGGTPLCRHINEVVQQIREMAPRLRASGQKACVIIATDGESSDGDIAAAMRPLKDLPAWVVVRLCTDEDKIVDYWNNIDGELELDMDVLDDLKGESGEIKEHNSWLTYGEPIHRMREFGIPVKELDLLDEAKLSLDQIRNFCSLL